MDEHTGEHPRIGAVDVIPFVPLGDTTMDDCVELARRFGAADRRALRPAGLPLRPRPRRGPTGSSWPTSGAASTRASRPRSPSTAASPTSGRRGCTRRPGRSRSAPGRSSSPTTSTSTRATSSSRSGSPAGSASRAAACPRSRPTGSGSTELGRAQVSMNLLDFAIDAAVAGLGDRPRRGRRGRRRARRVGADRAGAAGRVPGRRRPRRRARATPRSRSGSRRPPAFLRLRDFSPMQALELRLEAAAGRRPAR